MEKYTGGWILISIGIYWDPAGVKNIPVAPSANDFSQSFWNPSSLVVTDQAQTYLLLVHWAKRRAGADIFQRYLYWN